MLLALLLVLAAQGPGQDLSQLELHALVQLLPRHDEPDWETDPADGRIRLVPVVAEVRRRIEAGTSLDLECWRTILIDKGYLRWRAQWPVSEPFAVCLHLPALEQGLSVALVPRVTGWTRPQASHWELMCGLEARARWDREEYQVLGPLAADRRTIEFDLVPEYRDFLWKRGRTALPSSVGPIRIQVEPVASIDEVLTRRTDELPGRELLRSLRLEIQPESSGPGRVYLRTKSSWPRTLAARVDVRLVQGTRKHPPTSLWLNESMDSPAAILDGLPVDVAKGKRSAEGWTLRLQGTPRGVLRDWDATSYWAGSVEVLVADLIGR